MKNRNIQFKPTAGLLIPLLLACFAAVFVSAPAPALARDTCRSMALSRVQSFRGAPGRVHCYAHIVNWGNAKQLGGFNGTAESILISAT